MRIDTGKEGKRSKALHPKDAKKLPREAAKIPGAKGVAPHKLPRVYELLVVETTTSIYRNYFRYASKKERDEARALMEKRERLAPKYGNWRRLNQSHEHDTKVEYHESMRVEGEG